MIFKTIHIRRKHIIITLISLITIILATVTSIIYAKNRTVAVFSQKELYTDILEEGLPDSSEHKISTKAVLDKLLGFDISSSESIIKEFSPIFEDTGEENTSEEVPTQDETAKTEDTPIKIATPNITKEQIVSFGGVEITNATSYNINANEFVSADVTYNLNCDNTPEILIVHTHTTESYGEFGERNTDATKNVIAVGEEIKKVFLENNIGVIHDTTVHDYPSYQGAYTRTLTTIERYLKDNPTIKIVLDVHRDGYIYDDGSRLRKTTKINGEDVAQVMLVCGTDSLGLYHPSWRENLKLAAKIQSAATQMYPTLMRPIDLRTERFNMHTTNGSLLMEIGANGNTLEEAKRGAIYVSSAICEVIKQCYKP